MKIHNLIQQSPEWFAIRKGRMTASHGQEIGNDGKGLETYITELMADFYSTGSADHYNNKDTDRGNELEPVARSMYEMLQNVSVEEVGFVEIDEFTGCSPDGLVDKDGGVEIKAPNDLNHFKMIINGESEINKKYLWQCQMNLLLTKRKWWDLVFYNPNFQKSLIIFRIKPDKEMQEKLKKGIKSGVELIKKYKKTYDLQNK